MRICWTTSFLISVCFFRQAANPRQLPERVVKTFNMAAHTRTTHAHAHTSESIVFLQRSLSKEKYALCPITNVNQMLSRFS